MNRDISEGGRSRLTGPESGGPPPPKANSPGGGQGSKEDSRGREDQTDKRLNFPRREGERGERLNRAGKREIEEWGERGATLAGRPALYYAVSYRSVVRLLVYSCE
ncbi:unnamed protein product [Nezara viridula]|uniref:Uncharacterized protein n=1 Tax=Nezara viridula TaxID=85310 RepID=A0A9P0EAW0_NEZVI|nr:unnamed protein product [Nezara viridula]